MKLQILNNNFQIDILTNEQFKNISRKNTKLKKTGSVSMTLIYQLKVTIKLIEFLHLDISNMDVKESDL